MSGSGSDFRDERAGKHPRRDERGVYACRRRGDCQGGQALRRVGLGAGNSCRKLLSETFVDGSKSKEQEQEMRRKDWKGKRARKGDCLWDVYLGSAFVINCGQC